MGITYYYYAYAYDFAPPLLVLYYAWRPCYISDE